MDAILNSPVIMTGITIFGGILTTYLTLRYKGHIKPIKKITRTDVDQSLFAGYEKLIKQQQDESDRKQKQLDATQKVVKGLEDELKKANDLIAQLQRDLIDSKKANQEVVKQLTALKKQYSTK